jgi:kinetochor protein Mis14/NSL1
LEGEAKMAEFHRKIELQSPDDLQYLVSNIRRAADAEIERSLPRMEEEKEDDMRPRVEELVEEVFLLFSSPLRLVQPPP